MDERTMRFSKLAYFGIGVAFLVLLVILGVSLWGLHQTVKGFESIIHTEKLSDQLMHLFSDLKEAEDDQRLFLLTGESQYLSAYQAATKRIDQEIHTVNSLVDANTPLHEKVFPLQNLVRERLALLQEVIDVYENQSLEKAISLIRTGRGMRTMEKIRDLILGLDQEDTAFLGHQHHLVHRMERLTLLTMITGIGLILLTGFLTIWKLKRDLTERLLLEHRLFEETKLAELARLLGDIGHDIKNMLTPITMGTELLEQELDEYFNQLPETDRSKGKSTQEMSKEVIEMTRTGSKRIQERVKEIADAVKGRSSPPKFEPCQLEKVVGNVFETIGLFAQEKGVSLHMTGLDSLPLIQADERRLFNAFYNLINNAIPEVPPGGSVTVRGDFDPTRQTVNLSIEDTGRGMPPEVRDSLFTNHVVSSKPGGTGLGTKIIKDVVDAHRGSIKVESTEGRGTTFYIRLPVT